MSTIPKYALYGENPEQRWAQSLHYERIARRARHYQWKIHLHQHETLIQVLYVEEKHGTVHMNGQAIEFCAPCFIIIPAHVVHGFDFAPDIDGYVITALQSPLESSLKITAAGALSIFSRGGVIDARSTERFFTECASLFDMISREALTTSLYNASSANLLLSALLVKLSRLQQTEELPQKNAQSSRKTEQIERFRLLVRKSLGTLVSVERYASEIGITASQLRRVCQEVLGESPLNIINAEIIHSAQRDLAFSTMTVQEIAYSLGFDDPAYFSRFYRNKTGQTPSEFREQVQLQLEHSRPEAGQDPL
ncbi:helix-turn-helix domain-containing protein [Parathalassolituus penaei]|uniref:Helix-turn-helix domain-containing protein n=1 Tax=Parathalassolituus penaei TaxID=2997323 RepID=A0A9X3IT85_9GAMM|nr:helix-turn-helix domain-containing protein [Parathalassolituus penaei]MCY0965649.1 helix-turn-helix domain-containing protein [Parathalassolituus penaei]